MLASSNSADEAIVDCESEEERGNWTVRRSSRRAESAATTRAPSNERQKKMTEGSLAGGEALVRGSERRRPRGRGDGR